MTPVARDDEPPSGRRWRWRTRDVTALAAETILIIGSALVLVYFYLDITRISDYPVQPADPGEVKLYFDVPNVPAMMDVDIADRNDGKIDITVSTDKSYASDSTGFSLVFSGLLARLPELPIMQELDEHGCWKNIYSVPSNRAVRCSVVNGSSNGLPGNPKDTEQLIVSGQLSRNETGAMFAQVTLYPDHRYSTSAGKRTYFTLPRMGTTYLPRSMEAIPLDLGTSTPAFTPSKLDVVIDYRELKAHEKIDSVAPNIYRAGELSWIEVDAGLVKPWGSIVNITLEDAGQRQLYLIGVIIGLLAAIVPLITTSTWKRVSRIRQGTS